MKDDPLLEVLAQKAREERGMDDPRWDALTQGKLSAKEEAELAAKYPGPESPHELFRPLDPDEDESLDRQFATLADARQAPRRPKPVAKTHRPRALFLVAAAIAALLFAVALFITTRAPTPIPIVAYSLDVHGDMETLSPEPAKAAGPIRLSPGSRLSLRLTPASPVQGALSIRSFLVSPLETRPWNVPLLGGPGGEFHVGGTREALFEGVPAGDWEIVVMVGRPETFPNDADLSALARGGDPLPGLVILRKTIVLLPAHASLDAIDVQFAGCAAVRVGPVCEVDERSKIRIWMSAGSGDTIKVLMDNETATATAREVAGGLALTTTPHAGARELSVHDASRDAPLFRLKLDAFHRDPEMEARREEAQRASREGHADKAVALFEQVIARSRMAGRLSDEVFATFALSYTLIYDNNRFTDAENYLNELEPRQAMYPEARGSIAYLRGALAHERGDFRAAIGHFREAVKVSERLDTPSIQDSALEMWAGVYSELGRSREAMQRLDDLLPLVKANARPCRFPTYQNTRGYVELRSASNRGDLEKARSRLEDAFRLAGARCPSLRGEILTNLAIAEDLLGRSAETRHWIEEAARFAPPKDARLLRYQRLLTAKESFASGDYASAVRQYDDIGKSAERALVPELVIDAYAGKAAALAVLGRAKDACAAYGTASHALDMWSERVPLGEGRGEFLASREKFVSAYLEFLVGLSERGDAALCEDVSDVARRSIARMHESLEGLGEVNRLTEEQRSAWNKAVEKYRQTRAALEEHLSASGSRASDKSERAKLNQTIDEALLLLSRGAKERSPERPLSAPAKGELLLIYHPIAAGHWVGIGMSPERVLVRRLGVYDPMAKAQDRAALLLEPFRGLIEAAKYVRFLSAPPVLFEDLHTLPFQGQRLLDKVIVTYGLDSSRAAGDAAPKRALLVVDPLQNIPHTRVASDGVERQLRERGWDIVRLDGAAATRAATMQAMERPDVGLLHYVGHGVFEGEDGLDSALILAGGEALTLGDMLSMRHVPAQVVLLGCETAKTSAAVRSDSSGLGLAQAMVLAGAEAVVAAREPVLDQAAASLSMRLYQTSDADALDVRRQLGLAIRSLELDPHLGDLAFFRVVVR